MAHVALYREWRPMTFDEVVEQAHVVTALRQAVVSGQTSHAYLFSGTRGTGKTTVAKIFARAINCLSPHGGNPCNQCEICTGILNGSLLDVVEMDAASNNSVDTIRRIVDEVVFMPSQARFKVYIVDEAHMLSTGAFNALLKTLEEPPAHAVFILATTEPYRVPATILSRCQRYEFRRIPLSSLIGRLHEIATADGIAIKDEALDAIARLAEGGMRDAISLLDQVRMTVAPGHPVDRDDVLRMTGVADDALMAQVSRALLSGDPAALLDGISQLIMSGRDPARFLIDFAAYSRNLLVVSVSPDPSALLQVTREQLQQLQSLARLTDSDTLVTLVRELSALHGELRWSSDSRTTLEVGLLRLMNAQAGAGSTRPAGSGTIRPADSGSTRPAGSATSAASAGPASAGQPSSQSTASSYPGSGVRAASNPAPVAASAPVPVTASATVPVTASVPAPVAASAPVPVTVTAPAPVRTVFVASVPDPLPMQSSPLSREYAVPSPGGSDEPPLPEPPPEDPSSYDMMPVYDPQQMPRQPTPARQPIQAPASARAAAPSPVYERAASQSNPAGAPALPFAGTLEPVAADPLPGAIPAAAAAPATLAHKTPAPPLQHAPAAGTGDVFSEPPRPSVSPDDKARWQAIQDQLINDGQMTVYLFSRPAAFSFCGGELHLIFSDKDTVNCQELREAQNIKALRSAATRIVGTDTPVVVRLAADPAAEALNCPVPQEPVWITRVREAADAFGIPMKVEDN